VRHTLQPGELLHLPPGAPHGYRNPADTPARFLAWTVGGPMDDFFTTMSERVRELPRDLDVMQQVLQVFGVARAV
jgi:uncharacterized RmlC-like cupin family protein